jgi:hypothetical protein
LPAIKNEFRRVVASIVRVALHIKLHLALAPHARGIHAADNFHRFCFVEIDKMKESTSPHDAARRNFVSTIAAGALMVGVDPVT